MADGATYKHLPKVFTSLEDHEYKDKITDLMIEGLWSLETSLFSQMESESKRISKVKETISILENSLLDPQQVDKLDPGDKMALYNRLNTNMHKELALLQNFQHSIPQSLRNIESLDELHSERRKKKQQGQPKKGAEAQKKEGAQKERIPAAQSSEQMLDKRYINKYVEGPNGITIGRIKKVIDGKIAVLFFDSANFGFPLWALSASADENVLTSEFREEVLKSGPPYSVGFTDVPSWIEAVQLHFSGQPSLFPRTNKGPRSIREPDSEDPGNGNQGR